MDKKTAQRLDMTSRFILMDLADKQLRSAIHDVNVYESAHGYGYEDEYDERDYTRWTDNDDGFKSVWHKHCEALDEWRKARDAFCESMVAFTDGQIDFETARKMVANPRLRKKLGEITMGKVA